MKNILKLSLLMLLTIPILTIASEKNIDKAVEELELETTCEMKITSGLRTPEHNKKIGGAKNSYHLTDRARDVVPEKGCITIPELAKIACEFASVIEYKSHIHIDDREKRICKLL